MNTMTFRISQKLYLFLLKDGRQQTYFSLRRLRETPDSDFMAVNLPSQCFLDLDMEAWKKLSSISHLVNTAVNENCKNFYHLSGEFFVTISDPFLNIRKYYCVPEQKVLKHTKVGIAMNFYQWKSLYRIMQEIESVHVPELRRFVPTCWTHDNQLSAFDCSICHPFGDVFYPPIGFDVTTRNTSDGSTASVGLDETDVDQIPSSDATCDPVSDVIA